MYALMNPVIDQVTHLVVKEDSSPNTEYIVPVGFVAETMADTIRLRCSKAELEKMDPFIETTFIDEKMPNRDLRYGAGIYGMGAYYYLPTLLLKEPCKCPSSINKSRGGSWMCAVVHA